MSVQVSFECDGCGDSARGTKWLTRTFQSFSGRDYGFGSFRYDKPQDVAPDGWVPFDPYTGCCYCPKCWAEIQSTAINTQDSGEGE